MKKGFKKRGFGLLFLTILVGTFLCSYKISSVFAEEKVHFTNVGEKDIISLSLNESKEIKIIEEGYRINSCSIDGNNVSSEENSCTISFDAYGFYNMYINYYNEETGQYGYANLYVDVEAGKLLDAALKNVPSVVESDGYYVTDIQDTLKEKLPDVVNVNVDYQKCSGVHPSYSCTVEFYVGNQDYGIDRRIVREKVINTKSKNVPKLYMSNIDVGKKKNLNIQNSGGADLENYVLVSLDNTIASVSSTGEVEGKMPGKAEIRLYNKYTLEYSSCTFSVVAPKMSNQEFINYFKENREVEIDLNSQNILSYDYSSGSQTLNYVNTFNNYLNRYFGEVGSSESGLQNINVSCNGNKCSATYSVYSDDGTTIYDNHTGEITINLKGIRVNQYYVDISLGSSYNFKENITDAEGNRVSSDNFSVVYDSEFFRENEYGYLEVLKLGSTEIQYITDGYVYTKKLEIKHRSSDQSELYQLLNGMDTITLPYRESDFGGKLDILGNSIKSKISRLVSSENTYRNELDIKVICLFSSTCEVSFNITYDIENSYTTNLGRKNIKVKYENLAHYDNTLSVVADINNNIKSSYALSFDDTVLLEDKYKNDDDFYSHLIDYTGITNLSRDGVVVSATLLEQADISSYIKGSAKYRVTISKDSDVLLEKEIYVSANHFIDATDLDSTNEDDRKEYIRGKVSGILGKSVNVMPVDGDIYQILVDGKAFNVILDQKSQIDLSGFNLNERYVEVNVGEEHSISINTYPNFASKKKIRYTSSNESVATVSSDGIVRAIGNGFAEITLKYNYTTEKFIVCVGKTFQEYLDSFSDKIGTHFVVNYSDLLYMGEEDSIRYAISDKLSELGYYFINTEVLKTNGKYYYKLSVFNSQVTSSKKALTYEYKGIRINSKEILLDLNENKTHDLELFFSEGDFRNLIIDNSDKTVASISKEGIIEALKPGVVNVSIYDKYGVYYAYFTVHVNKNEYFDSKVEQLKNELVTIKGSKYSRQNNFNVQNVFNEIIYDDLKIYNYYSDNRTTCDTNNKTCTLYLSNSGYENVDRSETFGYKFEGIFVNSSDVNIRTGESYTPEYQVYPEDSNVSITSEDPSVCTVENGRVVAQGKGVCPVRYESSNDKTYQFFIVDEDLIRQDFGDALDRVPETIQLKNEKYNSNLFESECNGSPEGRLACDYKTMYDVQIEDAIFKNLSFPNKKYIVYFENNLDEIFINDSSDVYMNISYDYENSETGMYYSHPFGSFNKRFNYSYGSLSSEQRELGESITDKIPRVYELSLQQVLRYQMDNATGNDAFKYSSLEDDIKSVCSDCTYKISHSLGFGGMGDTGWFRQAFAAAIYQGDVPIGAKQFDVKVRFNITLEEALVDENQIIEIIKEEVKQAYKELKGQLQPKLKVRARTFGLMPQAEEVVDDVEVEVTREYDEDGLAYYQVTVEDVTFAADVGIIIADSVDVEYTQSPIKDFKIKTPNVNLSLGMESTLEPVFEATGEYDPTVIYKSSDESVVRVDANGKVLAVGLGTATITCRASNNMIYTVDVDVANYLLGDVSRDNRVDLVDVMYALRISLGLISDVSDDVFMRGDIDKSGDIDLSDVMYILRIALDLN